jgi:predicted HTH domain antitoxin
MDASDLALRLPGLLQAQVVAARDVGLYDDEADLIADAIQMLLAARPDVRIATACELYRRDVVSSGKAAELAGLDIVSFKRALTQRDIVCTAPESLSETIAMAQAMLRITERSA